MLPTRKNYRVFALLAVYLAAFCLAGCDRNFQFSGDTAAVTMPMAGFEQFRGDIVLVRFDSDAEDDDSQLIDAWAADATIPGLSYVRVVQDASAATDGSTAILSGAMVRVEDSDAALAWHYGVEVRPWHVLLDRHGRRRYSGSRLPAEILTDWVSTLAADKSGPNQAAAMFGVKPDGRTLLKSTRLKGIDGSDITLTPTSDGAGIILLFADTNCPYSEQAIIELPLLSDSFATMNYSVFIVNIGDDSEAVRDFYIDGGRLAPEKYSIAYDDTAMTQFSWGVDTVPRVFVLDQTGDIRYEGPALWMDVVAAAAQAAGTIQNTSVRGTGYG